MNAVIEKLKKEANVEHCGHGAFGEPERYCRLDPDKLIELVIKECVTKCKRDWYGDSLDDILVKMEKHFGVK